jgi:hypothetical protein
MGDFHAIQGWYFRRGADGSVVVRHGNGPDQEDVTLDANTWASVIAHVCARGENAATFQDAQDFHMVEHQVEIGDLDLIGRVPEHES